MARVSPLTDARHGAYYGRALPEDSVSTARYRRRDRGPFIGTPWPPEYCWPSAQVDMGYTQRRETETGFRRIRCLRASQLALFVGLVPFFALVQWLKAPDWLFSILALIWFSTWTVLLLVHAFVRCPNCHKLFNIRGLYGNPFTSKCLNCGTTLRQCSVANTPQPQSGSPPGGAGRGKMVNRLTAWTFEGRKLRRRLLHPLALSGSCLRR